MRAARDFDCGPRRRLGRICCFGGWECEDEIVEGGEGGRVEYSGGEDEASG